MSIEENSEPPNKDARTAGTREDTYADLAKRIDEVAAKLDAHIARFAHFLENWGEIENSKGKREDRHTELLYHHEDELWILKEAVFPESQKLIRELHRPSRNPGKDGGTPPAGDKEGS